MIGVSISTTHNTISREIKNIKRAFSRQSIHRVLAQTGLKFLQMAEASFGSSGQYRGNEWKPYSKAYARKVKSTIPTLYRSGALKKSLKMHIKGNWVQISSDSKYAATHFFGSTRHNIAARRFFPVENNGAASWRLIYKADKELFNEISRQLSRLSNNSLPRMTNPTKRSTFESGNPRFGF